jgi:hypothetical protein
MKMIKRNIIVNSTMLFVIASILTMTFHEFGHFITSIIVHAQQISIHHNYTSNSSVGLSLLDNVLIKSSGPVVSLIIGVVFHFICSRQVKRTSFFLFNVYMSLNGYIGFLGYLIIAYFVPGGDTGYVCYILGFPAWFTILMGFAGAVALYFTINSLMKYFVSMGSKEIIENEKDRKEFIRSLILYPLFIGLVITTLLNLPVPTLASLIAPTCGSLTLLCGYENALEKKYLIENLNMNYEQFNSYNLPLFALFLLVIIFNRLLVYGIYMN